MATDFMIYGATGYTGRLLAREAAERGLRPLVSGRNEAKLRELAEPLGLEHVAVSLDDRDALRKALDGVRVVLHAAGPFSATSEPMLDACLETGTSYLDITGEIDVFEACAARDDEARDRGILVMPGVGFDVVPSDCLAAHVKRRLPDATALHLAISGTNTISRGTAKTAVEAVRHGARVRRDGRIVELKEPLAREFDFGDGSHRFLAVAWGDVATAYHSTRIPDVTVYFMATRQLEKMAGLGAVARWLLGTAPMQAYLRRKIDQRPEGPSDKQRAAGRAHLLAVAENEAGESVRSQLLTPEGYTLTYLTGLAIVERVLQGETEPGFRTPSTAFGADFITEIEGCQRKDHEAPAP